MFRRILIGFRFGSGFFIGFRFCFCLDLSRVLTFNLFKVFRRVTKFDQAFLCNVE